MNLVTPQKQPIIQPKIYNETNYALKFDGVDDYVEIPHDNLPTGDFTIEGVLKTNVVKNGTILLFGNDSAKEASGFSVRYETGRKIRFISWGDYDYDVNLSETYADNEFHHWCIVNDTSDINNAKIYWEGKLVGESEVSLSINLKKAAIGRNIFSGVAAFAGIIDNVRIWDIAKTQEEIQNDINKELTGNENGLVACYKMNEGNGVILTDNVRNNNGQIIGATWQEVDY